MLDWYNSRVKYHKDKEYEWKKSLRKCVGTIKRKPYLKKRGSKDGLGWRRVWLKLHRWEQLNTFLRILCWIVRQILTRWSMSLLRHEVLPKKRIAGAQRYSKARFPSCSIALKRWIASCYVNCHLGRTSGITGNNCRIEEIGYIS